MRELIPRSIRRRLAALRPGEEAASPPLASARPDRHRSLNLAPPDHLGPSLEITTALGPCLCFRSSPEATHPELGRRLALAATALQDVLPAEPHHTVFLDLETLGLAAAPVFLTGVLHLGSQGFHVHQFLARDYAEEAAVLEASGACLSEAECLLTYNGRSFDWPFLADRRRLHRLPPLRPLRHLDLLPLARQLYRGAIPNCALATVEQEVLGVCRSGDIPGREIADLYHLAVARDELELLAPILHHNLVDLLSLACLASEWRDRLSA